ncbi:MAG: porphobilinogen synthase [Pseudomonadota bacterium]|jgi:porphobilinogen synthase|nr:porphobilinogen synthase [Alphaproteobacteria bacterium]
MSKKIVAPYPNLRLRRLRQSSSVRELFQETHVHPHDLIYPIFIRESDDEPYISTMPGIQRYAVDALPKEVEAAYSLGIRAILLFPKTPNSLKTDDAKEAFNPKNLICQAIRKIKASVPDMLVLTDVALDPYTSHGHDGFVKNGKIENDRTIEALVKQVLNQVEAGADGICPSDLMDGRIQAIRQTLEAKNHPDVLLISYAIKYASVLYGPFRTGVGANLQGDKKTYQINPANVNESLRSIQQNIMEGADAIIIKPGITSLDIIAKAQDFGAPIWAYQVSGEYAMIKYAAQHNALDEEKTFYEMLLSLKRAGAGKIITYAAKEIAQRLHSSS